MKSRGVYETPGGAILCTAHRQVESLTMDREVMHLRDSLIPKYAELVYYGFWFAPEREALQALVDESQKYVTGTVRLKLYKGNIITCGRKSQVLALQPQHRHDGRRQELVQPERRHRLHPPERPAFARPKPRPARPEGLRFSRSAGAADSGIGWRGNRRLAVGSAVVDKIFLGRMLQ